MAEQQHAHRTSSWIVVGLICVAAVLLGLAIVLENIPLGIVAIVLGLGGMIMGGVTRIMDDAY
ncbi:MAG TPA: hypothetical protein VFR07_11540 [Mycobacteriales bacterium]|jgi:hypothetical protein|nr:hypothetical protein [Mycobacteriales bacterium]